MNRIKSIFLLASLIVTSCGTYSVNTSKSTSLPVPQATISLNIITPTLLPSQGTPLIPSVELVTSSPIATPTTNLQEAHTRICVGTLDNQQIETRLIDAISQVLTTKIQTDPDFYKGEIQIITPCPSDPTILSHEWSGPAVGGGAPEQFTIDANTSMDEWARTRPAHFFIFVGSEEKVDGAFGKVFPRRTPQELVCQGHECAEITSAVYLTPTDIASDSRLETSLRALVGLPH